MIFVTHEYSEEPLFTGFVNGNWERETKNGYKIKMHNLGTRERKKDGTYQYSSWACDFMGEARDQNENDPLQKGDRIAVYGVKMTNTSFKNDNGEWSKPFFTMSVSRYKLLSRNGEPVQVAHQNTTEEDLAY